MNYTVQGERERGKRLIVLGSTKHLIEAGSRWLAARRVSGKVKSRKAKTNFFVL